MVAHTDNQKLVQQLEEDSKYFDHLVELVPAKFYFPNQQKTNFIPKKFLHSSTEKAAAKQQKKDGQKKAKRLKLDPSAAKSNIAIQKELHKQEAEDAALSTETTEENGLKTEENNVLDGFENLKTERAATYNQLRERLKRRLEDLRSKRHANESAEKARKAKEWLAQKQKGKEIKISGHKRKGSEPKVGQPGKQDNANLPKQQEPSGAAKLSSGDINESDLKFQFNRIKTTSETGKSKKGTRKPRTAQLLAKAAALQDQLTAAGKSEEGKKQASKHVWGAMAERAAGQKVLDNPKLLKKTMQKETSKRKKSAEKWQERQKREKSVINAKQKKRKDNLQERIDTKTKNRIAKREKKLMRPGFEGRSATAINKLPKKQ